jgi:hypothetical protein
MHELMSEEDQQSLARMAKFRDCVQEEADRANQEFERHGVSI